MLVDPSRIPAVRIFEAPVFPDERGFLLQSWVATDLAARGLPREFKQAIQTCSRRGVMRGLHFQWDPPMGKLVRCIAGAILDVVVDVRVGSPTLGHHVAVELRGRNHKIIWVPPGFAHGTFALEEDSIVLYECTAEHGPGREGGIRWNDPALAIAWPAMPTIVSENARGATAVARSLAATRSRQCPCVKEAWVALLADDRMLLGDPEGRALEVDETTLVLEQLEARTLPLGRSRRRLEILAALPPELRHAVVRFGPAAAGLQHAVERIFPRVHLDVSPDAERGRVAADERTVLLPPVALEVGARELGQAPQTEHELHHGVLRSLSRAGRGSASRRRRGAAAAAPSPARTSRARGRPSRCA